ncbi:MAG: nicotinate (nicotinamide) nucleotide adenylyltransferase, partial [Nitrospirae bacterium]|nr:nicotinate (nicotinamide) nucleotide adenylyltransferase [Nitrospirota bacterium]
MKKGLRIGIFGGTFNPIHNGHLAIAEEVLKTVGLDRVLLIPANQPPHKADREIPSARHRLAMVRLAVEDHPGLDVSDLEISRPGKSYTIDTLNALRRRYPKEAEFYLMLGLDAFLEFSTWRSPQKILQGCHIIVVSRPGSRFSDLGQIVFLKGIPSGILREMDAGRLFRYDYPLTPKTGLILLHRTDYEISATRIRDHLSVGKRLKNLLP